MVKIAGTLELKGGMKPGDQKTLAPQSEMRLASAQGDVADAMRDRTLSPIMRRPRFCSLQLTSCAKRPIPPEIQRLSYATIIFSCVATDVAPMSLTATIGPPASLKLGRRRPAQVHSKLAGMSQGIGDIR